MSPELCAHIAKQLGISVQEMEARVQRIEDASTKITLARRDPPKDPYETVIQRAFRDSSSYKITPFNQNEIKISLLELNSSFITPYLSNLKNNYNKINVRED